MTYEIIGIFDLSLILNDDALIIAASDSVALDNASRAVGARPLARAPDTPSSTR
jgi:hypothetical protein